MEWHSMPFSLLNGIFVKALWIQPALSLKPQTVLREEKICEWNLFLQILLLAVSRPKNDAFIASMAQQTKKAFLWHTTRCDMGQYNDVHYVCNTRTIFTASQQCASCISAFHQLEPRLNFSIKHAFFESHWQLGQSSRGKKKMYSRLDVPGPRSTIGKEMLRLQGLWSGDMAVFA